ncbi:MAG: hypothetical protein GKR88_13270 [Flavobacteriaceae bacterium]|nr:MAG: hypothetical protein GKR88_13270 [Flavobacteriaceae bacterium]
MRKSYCEKERNRLEKLHKFQLAHKYKKVGITIAIFAFLLMIAKKFVDEPLWIKPILSNILLLGMLIISVSKEKIEDEYIDSLRSQSYRLAFVFAIIYSLIQPGINYVVTVLLGKETGANEFSYFQVLFFMLIVQLLFFNQLKRWNK